MEIDWHWDAATYRELLADGGQPVRSFVERHRPHLLRAYGIDCLVNAVEITRRDLQRALVSVVSRKRTCGARAAQGGVAQKIDCGQEGFGRIRRAYSRLE